MTVTNTGPPDIGHTEPPMTEPKPRHFSLLVVIVAAVVALIVGVGAGCAFSIPQKNDLKDSRDKAKAALASPVPRWRRIATHAGVRSHDPHQQRVGVVLHLPGAFGAGRWA